MGLIPILHILTFPTSVNVTFITRDGEHKHVQGKVGDNVLYLAHRYGIELEGKSMLMDIDD